MAPSKLRLALGHDDMAIGKSTLPLEATNTALLGPSYFPPPPPSPRNPHAVGGESVVPFRPTCLISSNLSILENDGKHSNGFFN